MKIPEIYLRSSVARINSSFRCCPTPVIATQLQWQLKNLRHGRHHNHFYFNELKKGVLKSRTIIKKFVNAQHLYEISIVDNASLSAGAKTLTDLLFGEVILDFW